MARRPLSFVCQNCGAVYGRWQGKCASCGEWNTIAEEGAGQSPQAAGPGRPARKGRPFALHPLAGETDDAPRTPSGIAELDRVTGGGFVRGSVLLVGGDPGIGKSTLLIQAAAAIAPTGSGSAALPSSLPPRPRWRTSWPPSPRAGRRASWWWIRSRPCGPTQSNPPRAP